MNQSHIEEDNNPAATESPLSGEVYAAEANAFPLNPATEAKIAVPANEQIDALTVEEERDDRVNDFGAALNEAVASADVPVDPNGSIGILADKCQAAQGIAPTHVDVEAGSEKQGDIPCHSSEPAAEADDAAQVVHQLDVAVRHSQAQTLAPALPASRRSRRANPLEDNIWTRHHAISLMGALCDLQVGGYEAARNAEPVPYAAVSIELVITRLASTSPWLINARMLNLEGSLAIEEQGFEKAFHAWIANRIYYFMGNRNEHPSKRVKSNLKAVYREFYEQFVEDLENGHIITESRAQSFWIGVSNRVPFRLPAKAARGEHASEALQDQAAVVGLVPLAFGEATSVREAEVSLHEEAAVNADSQEEVLS